MEFVEKLRIALIRYPIDKAIDSGFTISKECDEAMKQKISDLIDKRDRKMKNKNKRTKHDCCYCNERMLQFQYDAWLEHAHSTTPEGADPSDKPYHVGCYEEHDDN